jgi:hypothetical protein
LLDRKKSIWLSRFDILPRLENGGFWGQTVIAGTADLTSPKPTVDTPTAWMF